MRVSLPVARRSTGDSAGPLRATAVDADTSSAIARGWCVLRAALLTALKSWLSCPPPSPRAAAASVAARPRDYLIGQPNARCVDRHAGACRTPVEHAHPASVSGRSLEEGPAGHFWHSRADAAATRCTRAASVYLLRAKLSDIDLLTWRRLRPIDRPNAYTQVDVQQGMYADTRGVRPTRGARRPTARLATQPERPNARRVVEVRSVYSLLERTIPEQDLSLWLPPGPACPVCVPLPHTPDTSTTSRAILRSRLAAD